MRWNSKFYREVYTEEIDWLTGCPIMIDIMGIVKKKKMITAEEIWNIIKKDYKISKKDLHELLQEQFLRCGCMEQWHVGGELNNKKSELFWERAVLRYTISPIGKDIMRLNKEWWK